MAAEKNVDAQNSGQFHPKCGNVTLRKDRRIASASKYVFAIAFTNDPISFRQKYSVYSVKILQSCADFVSPISASSRPHPSDAPYTAGGAVDVVHCCLFFVRSDRWCLLPATAACCH